MKTYSERLKDPRWQRKRLEIMERDGFACRDCGDEGSTLHVHHCIYQKGQEPWQYPNQFLRTLCKDCHEVRHDYEERAVEKFKELLARMDSYSIEGMAWQIKQVLDDDGNYDLEPWISSITEASYLSQDRWFGAALENPDMRKFYEMVTGTHPDWNKLDSNLKTKKENQE